MPWYLVALLVCAVIAPFDALYMYIKAERRKEELRRKKEAQGENLKTGSRGDER